MQYLQVFAKVVILAFIFLSHGKIYIGESCCKFSNKYFVELAVTEKYQLLLKIFKSPCFFFISVVPQNCFCFGLFYLDFFSNNIYMENLYLKNPLCPFTLEQCVQCNHPACDTSCSASSRLLVGSSLVPAVTQTSGRAGVRTGGGWEAGQPLRNLKSSALSLDSLFGVL